MVSMPNISVAKPSRMVPVSRRLPLFPAISSITPTSARTGLKEDGLSICTQKLPL